MDHPLDTEMYRAEVYNESELEMAEEQREELLGLMRELKYGFAYGPCSLAERYFDAPVGADLAPFVTLPI